MQATDPTFHELVSEIVDLSYTGAASINGIKTASEMCAGFLDILQRHWKLSSSAIYLKAADENLIRSAFQSQKHVNTAKAETLCMIMAEAVEHRGHEVRIDRSNDPSGLSDDEYRLDRALADAGVASGVAVPINAQGSLKGVLVALTLEANGLIPALNAIRFLAAPVIVAVGRARQGEAIRQQHEQIERLVEELRRHSLALEEANAELRRIALYRSMFLARMSHELRTPLTAILGFAEILLDHEKMPDTQRGFCQRIQNSGLQLQSSLNQLVDLSRLEGGRSELYLHEFSFRETLRESCASVARLAQKQNVRVDCEWGPDLNSIVSDEGKLRQVLYNFLANGISRSPSGGTVLLRAERLENSAFRTTVEDHGPPQNDLARFFEPIQIDETSEKPAAMGQLGLVIARRLIDVLGGSVRLETSGDVGLRVLLDLPELPRGKEHAEWAKV